MIELTINGKKETTRSTSLIDLIQTKKLEVSKVAVIYNDIVLEKTDWNEIILKNNDDLELITFVGGG
ncbi:MAG: sulfur carrier protein ThiS [Candidatus Margulisiibacteriota bacterium]|jgi:sulfur carrier protein